MHVYAWIDGRLHRGGKGKQPPLPTLLPLWTVNKKTLLNITRKREQKRQKLTGRREQNIKIQYM